MSRQGFYFLFLYNKFPPPYIKEIQGLYRNLLFIQEGLGRPVMGAGDVCYDAVR